MRKSRILICGGRNFKNYSLFDRAMAYASKFFNHNYCIIHGGAKGADSMGSHWAFQRGIPIISMAANWNFYGDEAGPIRNGWMLSFAFPDLVIAFPGGPGTADMIAQTKARNIDLWVVPSNF